MATQSDPAAADREFFRSLLTRDVASLDRALTTDFILIDVMTGSRVPRDALLDLVGSGQLLFESIDSTEVESRRYGTTAVITGRTQMRGRFDRTPFTAESRYTHVFVEQDGRWRLASAQGTPIRTP
ncbi:MAG TPA: nuclear transport factor 2 family protein [Gemmatimonadales bacterium]|nr:nuclear transport factor 2 family protein [Gemmatimonadales bacterium]